MFEMMVYCTLVFIHIITSFYIFIVFQFRNFKIIYRRYAGLYFCICVDVNDNNLCYLEAIHNFVEVLNEYFHNVCELDLVFNFYKVSKILLGYFSAVEHIVIMFWSNHKLCINLLKIF